MARIKVPVMGGGVLLRFRLVCAIHEKLPTLLPTLSIAANITQISTAALFGNPQQTPSDWLYSEPIEQEEINWLHQQSFILPLSRDPTRAKIEAIRQTCPIFQTLSIKD